MGNKKRNKGLGIALAILLLGALGFLLFYSFNRPNTALTEAEGAAIAEISAGKVQDFTDISADILTKERRAKFPAVSKAYQNQNYYAFIVEPIAYNGPIKLALVIDAGSGKSLGMRIVDHLETPHYVRDMESAWFTQRFAGKSAGEYLTLVRLKPHTEQDIAAITGATVTTEGIINGVNAAFGVFQESILGTKAGEVPYMVRFEPGEGDGPVETGSLALRAYGTVLAEISLEDIRSLPSVKRTLSVHSTAGVTRHEFRGTLLSNVLNLAGPELTEEYRWILAVGVDDYISGISMEEVMAENNVYLMYEDNGQPLTKKNGEPGAMRVVVLNDMFGQRFTNYLLEIVLENEEP